MPPWYVLSGEECSGATCLAIKALAEGQFDAEQRAVARRARRGAPDP